MNHPDHNSVTCEEISESLLEFALGTIAGRDRSRVLDHLESCPRCRSELESLVAVTDALLWLAPEAEPPLGFESRLVERLRSDDAIPLPARRHRVVWLAAAALLFGLAGFGVSTAIDHGSTSTQLAASRPLMGRLTSSGKVVGQVFVSAGRPSWIYMTLDDGSWTGIARCQVTLKGGRVETVGRFTLSHGYGAWAARIGAAGDEVRSARLVDLNGRVIASATLHV